MMLMVIATATPAVAEELYLGRVLDVDREGGRVSVTLMEAGDGVQRDGASPKGVRVVIPQERLPRQLSPGDMVRIWGNLSGKTPVLDASSLMVTGRGSRGKDPTGVRRRIGKGRGYYGGRGGGKGHGRR